MASTATPPKLHSAKELLALIALPLDDAPEVKLLAAAAEAAERVHADLFQRERKYQTLWNPHYRQTLGRDVGREEMLDAATKRPAETELALAEAASVTAAERLKHARETERQRRLWALHEFRKTEMAALAVDYQRLVTRYAPLTEVESAFHEAWPTRVCDRYGALVSGERLEAWRVAARTEGIDV